jgi:hypothetical protein
VAGQLAAPFADLAATRTVSTLPAWAKEVTVATALVPGAVLTSVVRISVMSACLPGVREPILPESPALAAPPSVANRSTSDGASWSGGFCSPAAGDFLR